MSGRRSGELEVMHQAISKDPPALTYPYWIAHARSSIVIKEHLAKALKQWTFQTFPEKPPTLCAAKQTFKPAQSSIWVKRTQENKNLNKNYEYIL